MSLRVLPVLYINLGGEMMYILNQRLEAQKISLDKAQRVRRDIVGTMLSPRFVEELFKPQDMYSQKAMRSIFEKLTHASIMRLNSSSMDKLYDLMTMVFKYQVFRCATPNELLLVTLNHLDAIGGYVTAAGQQMVDNVSDVFLKNYRELSLGEFQMIRYLLLNFFQDLRVRVSVFLKSGAQHPNGLFDIPTGGTLPPGVPIPGTIREYGPGASVLREGRFESHKWEQPAERTTSLGTNIYSPSEPRPVLEAHEATPMEAQADAAGSGSAELSLLLHLLGSGGEAPDLRWNLFQEANVQQASAADASVVLTVDASRGKAELDQVLADLTLEEQDVDTDGCDLLDLMDSTECP